VVTQPANGGAARNGVCMSVVLVVVGVAAVLG
jgi:hypothetical protein